MDIIHSGTHIQYFMDIAKKQRYFHFWAMVYDKQLKRHQIHELIKI